MYTPLPKPRPIRNDHLKIHLENHQFPRVLDNPTIPSFKRFHISGGRPSPPTHSPHRRATNFRRPALPPHVEECVDRTAIAIFAQMPSASTKTTSWGRLVGSRMRTECRSGPEPIPQVSLRTSPGCCQYCKPTLGHAVSVDDAVCVAFAALGRSERNLLRFCRFLVTFLMWDYKSSKVS